VKALDGTDVLAVFPTSTGETGGILTVLMLVLTCMKVHSDRHVQHTARFLTQLDLFFPWFVRLKDMEPGMGIRGGLLFLLQMDFDFLSRIRCKRGVTRL